MRRIGNRMKPNVKTFRGYLSTLHLTERYIVVEVDMNELLSTETILPSSMLLTVEYVDIVKVESIDSKLLIYIKDSDRPISLVLENAHEAAIEITKRISHTKI